MRTVSSLSSLSVSIVSFSPDMSILRRTLATLWVSLEYAHEQKSLGEVFFWLIDNGPGHAWGKKLQALLDAELDGVDWLTVRLISGQGNMGYGKGHNMAIKQSACDCHLVLNPDVVLEQDAIHEAINFMETHKDVGLLAPSVMERDGTPQYLCKRYPSVLDLFLRGLAPPVLKRVFRRRLDYYEMRDLTGPEPLFDVPMVGGAFIFGRCALLNQLGGFSKDFFMYFEDFDLSLRAGKLSRTAYVPSVKITHTGGNAAQKGLKHIVMFVRSALTFFGRHGWKWF
jgi:GT2 family glycosyltransferase